MMLKSCKGCGDNNYEIAYEKECNQPIFKEDKLFIPNARTLKITCLTCGDHKFSFYAHACEYDKLAEKASHLDGKNPNYYKPKKFIHGAYFKERTND